MENMKLLYYLLKHEYEKTESNIWSNSQQPTRQMCMTNRLKLYFKLFENRNSNIISIKAIVKNVFCYVEKKRKENF